MRFCNREKELAGLGEIASLSREAAHLMVITGRRRVGKTELVRRFAAEREDFLYFFVSKKKPLVLLDEFRDLLAANAPLLKTASFASFADFFTAIFSLMQERTPLIVFDERLSKMKHFLHTVHLAGVSAAFGPSGRNMAPVMRLMICPDEYNFK